MIPTPGASQKGAVGWATVCDIPAGAASDFGRRKVVQSWDTASTIGAANDYSFCTTRLIANVNFYGLKRAKISAIPILPARCVAIFPGP